jgi:chromosome segregation ATPase
LNEAQEEIEDLKTQMDQSDAFIQNKEAEIESQHQQILSLLNVKEQNGLLQKEVSLLKAEREQLSELMQKNQQTNEGVNRRLREEFETIQKERECINEELNELFVEKSEKDVIIKTLTNENLELTSRMTALEQLLCAKEDSDARMDELQESYKKLNSNKEKYKNDLEICTNYLLEVEEKC